MIGGRIDMVVAGVPPITGLLSAGNLRALAVTGPKRVAVLPEVPTTKELGYDDLTFVGWFGLLAPTGTPQSIIDKLNAEAKAISQQPGIGRASTRFSLLPWRLRGGVQTLIARNLIGWAP